MGGSYNHNKICLKHFLDLTGIKSYLFLGLVQDLMRTKTNKHFKGIQTQTKRIYSRKIQAGLCTHKMSF